MNNTAVKICLQDSIFQKTVMDNGVRILTENLPYLKSVSLCIWVQAGSRVEESDENGICHLLEHMMFKGTARRDALQISKEIECVGGSLNAFTGKEATSYFCRVLSDDLPLGSDVLTDMYLNSSFPESEMKWEKQVICQEIHQLEDSPEDYVSELFQMRFWQGDPFGRPILGTIDDVLHFDREKLIKFKEDHYDSRETIVCAVGNLCHEDIVDLIKGGMGSLKNGSPRIQPAKPKNAPGALIQEKDLEQVHLCVGVEGPSAKDDNRNTAYIFNTLFGGGMSSRLFQEVREKRGLAYSIYSFYSPFSDTGMIGIGASTEPDKFEELLDVMGQETLRVANTITGEELQNAKNQLRGTIIMSNESAESRIGRIIKAETTYGRYISVDEIINDIEKITLGEIRDFASSLFNPGAFTAVALGQVPKSMNILGYFNRL